MRAGIASFALVCFAALSPQLARAQQCANRYSEAFPRLNALGPRNLDLGRAATEVNNLFGPRPDKCEAGAYQRFVESFKDFAREAFRAPTKTRDGWLRIAMAAAGQSPQRVPAEEHKADVALFRQTRSDLFAIADDAGISPLMQQVLDTFDRSGPPGPLPPQVVTIGPGPGVTQAPPTGTGAPNIQQVRVPTVPLPSWAVVSLYEIRESLHLRDPDTAKAKLDALLKWMETAP